MPSVDNRVVRLEFDNAEFERRIDGTLRSIAQLNEALKFEGATKGLAGVNDAAKGLDLHSIAAGVDHIASRFTALGAVAFSVIQQMTQGALGFAKKVGGDILEPIIGGGRQRALNLEQARFLFEGIGMDVDKAMASARKAVLGTAFGLDEAAKAGAQFGASGVDAGDEMYKTLRGVAGVAAMTNSQFSEMADVFTQAAGQGKISGYTLERISMRGLNAAAAYAKQTGKTEAQVREMASNGEISFKQFAKAMDDAFGAHAQEANKTYTGALENMQAALARVGAEVFTPQLRNQRDLFNALTPAIDKVHEALMPLINAFNFLTTLSMAKFVKGINAIDFTNLTKAMPIVTKGFINIWVAIDKIKKIATTAFREIFPPGTGSMIIKIATAFEKFTEHLKIAGTTANNIKSIFKGVFSIFSIGWTVVKEGIKFLMGLVGSLLHLSGGDILGGLAKVGDFFTTLQQQLVKGKGIETFFKNLTRFIKEPIQYIKDLKDTLAAFFDSLDPKVPDKVGVSLGRVSDRFEHLRGLLQKAADIWRPFGDALQRILGVLDTIWTAISNWFKELGQKMAAVMKKGDFNAVIDTLNMTLLGGITAILWKFMHQGIQLDFSGGVFQSIIGTFNQLTDTLKTMQMQIKANIILKIASALAILTASVVVLSMIDSAALTKALTAMAVGFGQLMGAFALLNKFGTDIKGGIQFDLVAGGFIAVAAALVILAAALKIFASISWGDIAKGLVTTTALIVIMVASSKLLAKAAPGMMLGGVGLSAMGIGLSLLAGAVALMGQLDWLTIGKGLIGIAGALVVIALAMNMMPATLPLTGAGLILVATALNILAGAMKMFGMFKWGEIGKGMVVLAGALIIIGVAMNLMPAYLPLIGAGLVLVAMALNGLAGALKIMGTMSWGDIAKSLVVLAGALVILAIGVTAMSGAIAGAAALVVVSFALGMLAEVLKSFADLSWGDLLHGLLGIAAALAALGIAAMLLEPAIGAMMGLGAALLLIGGGFALVGVGAMLIAKSFEMLASSGKAAAAALVDILKSIGKSLGALGRGIGEGLLEMVKSFLGGLPVIMKLLRVLLIQIIDTVIALIPKIKVAFMEYIDAAIQVIYEKAPEVIQAGIFFIEQLLMGIRDNIGQITTEVADIIINFINALTAKVPEMVDSVYKFILAVIEAVLVKLQQLPKDMFGVVGRAIMQGMYGGILRKAAEIAAWFGNLGLNILKWIGNLARTLWNKGRDIIGGFLGGIVEKAAAVASWVGGIAGRVLGWIGNLARTLWNKGRDIISGLLGGIGEMWSSVSSWLGGMPGRVLGAIGNLGNILKNIGSDIINGLWSGMKDMWDKVSGWLGGIGSKIKSLKGPPEKDAVLLYENGTLIMNGLHEGMSDGWDVVESWLNTLDPADAMAGMGDSMAKTISAAVAQVQDMDEFQPVITPVLDLTKVAADASQIAGYISPVSPLALNQATSIAASTNAAKSPDSTTATDVSTGGVKFEQNIYAPERLSTADIYKQTRNQITMAKEELSIP